MENLFISEILLSSNSERKARKVTFDRKRTMVLGKNHTGKSSLIKSIYWTFGADPILHDRFKVAKATCLVKFSVGGAYYQILRDGRSFGVFNDRGEILKKGSSVSKDLAPYLARLFNFTPLFQTSKNEFQIPPPGFLFLPYYVDQDKSWTKSWDSFEKLQQFKSPRKQAVQYHSGIRPNQYYSTKKEIEGYLNAISELGQEQKLTNTILSQVKEKLGSVDFNFDVEAFKEEIKELLTAADELKRKEEKLKHNLLDLYNAKAIVEAQIEITKRAIKENHKDLEFASEVLTNHVACPTCGAEYENSFAERFEIASDEEKSKELLIELTREVVDIGVQIESENEKLVGTIAEVEKIENLLSQKKGDLALRDVIDHQGKNRVKEIFSERIKFLTGSIVENTIAKGDLEKKLKALENKDRRKAIADSFEGQMRKFFTELDLPKLSDKDFRDVAVTIEKKELGSARPRALVAYYFAFFNLMKEWSSSVYCPLIIDSPNQQDQDIEHIDKIMGFINSNQPDGSQMILGMAETYGVDFNCPTVNLTEKFSLLNADRFDEVQGELTPLVESLWLK